MDYHGSALSADGDVQARLEYLGERPNVMRAIGRAALDALLLEDRVDASRVAAIGYCFGACVMLELARDGADLQAVVAFHPGSADHDAASSSAIRGKVLICIGSEDPWMPVEARIALEQELRSAGVDWQINLYGGAKHSFTNKAADDAGIPEVGYDEVADQRSWRAMNQLLNELFEPLAGARIC